MKTNLMIHCGGHGVERGQLREVGTPAPTETWFPIPHHRLVAEVESSLERSNLRVVSEAHALAHDGDRYFGLLHVANGQNSNDHAWVLGLRNSHDQTFPAGLVVGSQVFVCDNLAFSGEIRIGRKHTRYIMRDLPELVHRAVGRLVDRWHSQEERIEQYRGTELSAGEAHDLVIRALDARAICATEVPKVLEEYRRPRHPEFSDRNAWSLFNAVTEVQKGGLWRLPRRTEALHGVMDAHCGLAVR
jgi:hypothetical protein